MSTKGISFSIFSFRFAKPFFFAAYKNNISYLNGNTVNGWMDRRLSWEEMMPLLWFFLFLQRKQKTNKNFWGEKELRNHQIDPYLILKSTEMLPLSSNIFLYFPFHRSRYNAGIMRWSMKKNFALLNFLLLLSNFFSQISFKFNWRENSILPFVVVSDLKDFSVFSEA